MFDPDKRLEAILKVLEDLGPWDMTTLCEPTIWEFLLLAHPIRIMRPGIELSENEPFQAQEIGAMTPEDYDFLINEGFLAFASKLVGILYPELGAEDMMRAAEELPRGLAAHSRAVRRQTGTETAVGGATVTGFEYLSFARSFEGFYLDLHLRPEKVLAAAEVIDRDVGPLAASAVEAVGINRVAIGIARGASEFISPQHFEHFALPSIERIASAHLERGNSVIFHADCNWTGFLHYFKRFPAGRCIMMLDGFTDIFEAARVLGGHMCIMGDVPATLLAFGSRDEVRQYCQRLIREVGADGGFILGSGCSIPFNARPENVVAMREAVMDAE